VSFNWTAAFLSCLKFSLNKRINWTSKVLPINIPCIIEGGFTSWWAVVKNYNESKAMASKARMLPNGLENFVSWLYLFWKQKDKELLF
jgi:hypothetical protein